MIELALSTTSTPHAPTTTVSDHTRLRRARCLVCYWDDQRNALIGHPYPDGTPVALPTEATDILTAFADWTSPHEATRSLSGNAKRTADEAIRFLADNGALLAEGSGRALRDADIHRHWAPWAPQAPFLHYTTDFTPHSAPAGSDAATGSGAASRPEPLFVTYPDADRVLLPRYPADLEARFGQVLHERRTHYAFSPDPLPLPMLAALLQTVFAPVDFIDAGPRGALYRRTSPSAGARQELEAYLAAPNVAGLAPGWYHYNALEHTLELIAEGCRPDEVAALCADQSHAGQAAFLVVLVAVTARQLDHHPSARSYRVCLLNAGHLGQTFVLTATALGLGSFQISACSDGALADRFGLDGVTRLPLHVVGAGLPGQPSEPVSPPAGLDSFRRAVLLNRHSQ